MTCTLILVRHAPTWENQQHILIGRTDPSLDDIGQALAQRVADALMGIPLQLIVTSPLQRARQTAATIAKQQRAKRIETDARLQELHLGVVDGVSSFAAYEQYQAEFDRGLCRETPDFAFPEGEYWSTAQKRIDLALCELAARHPQQTIGVVSHGALLGLFRAHLAGQPLGWFRHYQPRHASFSVVRKTPTGWEVIRWNETSHLADGD